MRARYTSVVLICAVLLSCENLRQAVGTSSVNESTAAVSEFSLSHPDIAVLKDGSCMTVFVRGNEAGSQSIALTRSRKNIRGWSRPADIIRTAWRAQNPAIAQLMDGLVVVLFSQSRFDENSGKYVPIGVFMTESYDDGRTFTAPRMVIQDNGRDIQVSGSLREIDNGRMVFAAWSAAGAGGESDCFVFVSDDRGISWRKIPVFSGTMAGSILLSNPSVIQTEYGCVCLMQGSDGFLYQSSASRIDGEWPVPRRTNLEGAAPCLAFPETGTLYTLFSDTWPLGISTARSYNRGMTWEDEKPLTQGNGVYGSISLKASGSDLFYVWLNRTSGEYSVNVRQQAADLPRAPRGVSAALLPDSTVHIRWNTQAGVDYYVVYRGPADSADVPGKMRMVHTAAESRYADHSIEPGKGYWYQVTAVCGAGKLMQDTGMESRHSKPVRIYVK